MTTSLTEIPCMNRTEIENPGPLYPLEVDRFQDKCKVDEVTGKTYDERFLYTGGQISELDVQSESGIYQNLISLPLYEEYTGRFYRNEKGGKRYKFWIRPTITWNRTCEQNLPRPAALKLF